MRAALSVIWRGVMQFEHYGWLFVMANLLTALLALPIITASAAYAALSHLSYTAQTSPTASLDDYWSGFRLHFWRGLLFGLLNILIFGIIGSNLYFYRFQTTFAFVVMRLVWITAALLWLAIQTYFWPLLEAMEPPGIVGALRNSLLMVLLNPLFTFTLLAFEVVLFGFSFITVIPLLLITGGLLASIGNTAVHDRLLSRSVEKFIYTQKKTLK